MSNHGDSYLLNDLLKKTASRQIFKKLGKNDTQAVLKEIMKISDSYGCNWSEIMEDMGNKLGVCIECLRIDQPIGSGTCAKCGKEWER